MKHWLLLLATASTAAWAQNLVTADTAKIDQLARKAIQAQYPEIAVDELLLNHIRWSQDYPTNETTFRKLPISVSYQQREATTNVVAGEPLEKRIGYAVRMGMTGDVPQALLGVHRTTNTLSVSRSNSSTSGQLMLLNFRNSPIEQVANFYADVTGISVAIAPGVHGSITCQSATRLSLTDACKFIEAVLNEAGFLMLKQADGSLLIGAATQQAVGANGEPAAASW
jgi:hypothetical protein